MLEPPDTEAEDGKVVLSALSSLARAVDRDDTTVFSYLFYVDTEGRSGDDHSCTIRMVIFLAASGMLLPLDLPLGVMGGSIHINARNQAGMFEWLQSPFVGFDRVPGSSRPERRRLARKGEPPMPDIKVVVLRRAARPRKGVDEPTVEWSCRWLVRGHWHRYWTGPRNTQTLKPQWIAPYIKGPDDRPLKNPMPTVRIVRR